MIQLAESKPVLLDACYCSPIGNTPEEVVERLKAGKSGITRLVDHFSHESEVFLFTGALITPSADFPDARDLHPRISERYGKVLGGFCRALSQLVARAGRIDRLFLIYRRQFFSEWPDSQTPFDEDQFVRRFLSLSGLDMPPSQVVFLHAACSSGLVALNMALRQLRHKPEQRTLIIGLESELNQERFIAIKKLGAISPEKDPARSCQPFSTVRSGLVPGEVMVAALVGSKSVADLQAGDMVLTPGANNSDGSRLTDCLESGEFLGRCLSEPLKSLQGPLDFVCPHGTSTPLNDRVEGQLLNRFFDQGVRPMRVVPLKQYVGHTLNSSGLFEAILNVEFLRHNFLPPILNVDPQETFEHLEFVSHCLETPLSRALKVSIGFGGINSSVLIEKVG